MIKKVFLFSIIILTVNQIFSQEKRNKVEPFYVNVFVNKNKTIYIETEKTQFKDIEQKSLRNNSDDACNARVHDPSPCLHWWGPL